MENNRTGQCPYYFFYIFFQDRAVFANQARDLLSRMDKDASFFEELESRSLDKVHHAYIFENNRGEIREMLLQFEVNENILMGNFSLIKKKDIQVNHTREKIDFDIIGLTCHYWHALNILAAADS